MLWTVVNERDGLGDETPPDYLTSVRDGGFYGWPYCYWGQTVDDRVPQDPAAGRQGHHAGLCARRTHRLARPVLDAGRHAARAFRTAWRSASTAPGIAATLSGYKVVFVPFENGRPSGPARDILSGFLAPDERESYGRPVGVTLGPDGSLLVADDVGDVIWRVTGA